MGLRLLVGLLADGLRVRQGLLEYQESAECWRKALATFPSENLTQAEQQQKRHCEDELKIALSRLSLTEEDQLIPVGRELQVLMPWNRVKTMEAELKAGLPGSAMSSVSESSGFCISPRNSDSIWLM